MKKPKTENNRRQLSNRGFTLVEMMVVMVILGLIVVGVMGVIISQNTNYHSEESLIDMQLNASIAMDRLSREIRMAGFGCSDGLKDSGITISGTTYNASLVHTNNATGPDQLTIISGLEQVSLVKEDNLGGNTVKLVRFNDSSNNPYFSASADDKKFCYISPAASQTFLTVTGANSGDSSITLNQSVNVFQNNTVYRVRAYTFSIRPANNYSPPKPVPNLVRKIEGNSLGRVEVAEGIEDLQFQFGWDINEDGTFNPSDSADWVDTIDSNPGNANYNADKVIAVRIILLAITLHPEKEKDFTDLHDDDPSTPGRQYVQADHAITYTNSGYLYGPQYHRQRQETIVFIRNLSY